MWAALQDLLGFDVVRELGARWVDEITDTYMDRLAEALVNGGGDLEAVLGDEAHAKMIAITEVTRAGNEGRARAYANARVREVRWVTHSGNPCQHCLDNEAEGPVPLGHVFSSGDTSPPAHPNCQCTLEPA